MYGTIKNRDIETSKMSDTDLTKIESRIRWIKDENSRLGTQ